MRILSVVRGLMFGASAAAVTAVAGPSIEAGTFVFALPDGWTSNLESKPISAKGTRGELLQISASSLTGSGSPEEARTILKSVEDRAVAAARAIEADTNFKTVEPLTAHGTLRRMISASTDGKRKFVQFVVTGPRTVIFASLDTPVSAASSIEDVTTLLKGIRWKAP